MKDKISIVIFTALPNELKAIEHHLTSLKDEFHSEQGTLYRIGDLPNEKGALPIAVVETEPNNVKAAIEVERALSYFKPSYAFFVGVAGGIKEDVVVGDVVVATKIYAYEVGKADKTYLPRFEFGEPSYQLKQFAKAADRANIWRNRVDSKYKTSISPNVFLKPIAAGEKVVSYTKSKVFKFLKAYCSDALAVAMEEYGFTESTKAHRQVEGMVVRGISDLIDGKGASDASGSQEQAAANAAAFTFEIIIKLLENGKIQFSNTDAEHPRGENDLFELFSNLYPKGITDKNIWTRAGGEISNFNLTLSGKEQWFNAVEYLNKGGGAEISIKKLLKKAQKDFSSNEQLKSFIKKNKSRKSTTIKDSKNIAYKSNLKSKSGNIHIGDNITYHGTSKNFPKDFIDE